MSVETAANARAVTELMEITGGLRRVTRRRLREDIPPPRLRGAQIELLHVVSDRPGIGVTAAARHLHLADNSVSTLVNQLVANGMLLREPDPVDRRAARLQVTEEARERMARWRERRASLVGAVFGELTDADRAAVEAALPALRRMLERLEERP